MYGTVARLTLGRESGCIEAIDGRELFFHRSALRGVELEAFVPGLGVEFELGHGPSDAVGEGPRATSVRLAEEAAPPPNDGEF